MIALHKQCLGEARQAAKFDLVKPPTAWLDWDACQRARLRAEHVLAACDGNRNARRSRAARAHSRVRRARAAYCTPARVSVGNSLECSNGGTPCSHVHPSAFGGSRVGVYRRLQLGGTLKAVGGGGYQIDLSERGAHKTCTHPRAVTLERSRTLARVPPVSCALSGVCAAAVFGPSRTTVTAAVAARIHALVTLDALVAGEYLTERFCFVK